MTKTTRLPDELKEISGLLFVTVQVVEPPGEIVLPEVLGPQSALPILAGSGAKEGPVPVMLLPTPVMKTVTGRLKTFVGELAANATFTT